MRGIVTDMEDTSCMKDHGLYGCDWKTLSQLIPPSQSAIVTGGLHVAANGCPEDVVYVWSSVLCVSLELSELNKNGLYFTV